MNRANLPSIAIALAAGVGLGALVTALVGDDARQCRQAGGAASEARIARLEAELARRPAMSAPPAASGAAMTRGDGPGRPPDVANRVDASRPDVDRLLKDLLTLAWNDRRDFSEKLEDFLAEHPGSDGIAIASKGVSDLGDNRDVLSDDALKSMYRRQQDPALQRVLAQVASMRGDNSLIESHAGRAAVGLHSPDAGERQRALVELARIRHVAAADIALPMLRDPDTGVLLDALLALRATGNQRHVGAIEPLLDHPDEAVAWLATDVVTELQSLSESARTRVAHGELAAELPPLPLPDASAYAACGLASG
ncbi:hypothetical protein FZO89_12270 [Luteimonas viscosa]|uniref:Uncharacterized protein n=1 Tax=Luteimonas viscosa TaxID=1132694 RepID=A0A5D4XVB1_9GAMM|nr:hypothetical protein [Luteimonas viscosa]TYT26972.1 hypothetical protein FZO89_12270 [Luteimonas viscosa]